MSGLLPTPRELFEPWLVANFVLLTALSFVVVYQAFRGYRRHDSRPMLFLALGILMLTIVPHVVIFVGGRYYSAQMVGYFFSPLSGSIRVVGVASIVYSLYGRT